MMPRCQSLETEMRPRVSRRDRDVRDRDSYLTNPSAAVSALHNTWLIGYRTLRPQDTSASRHSGTLRHRSQDTSRHQKRVTRHFDTSAVIEEKPGHFDPGQFRWDTAPPVFRLKLRHQFCGAPKCLGAEVSCGRSVWLPVNYSRTRGPVLARTETEVSVTGKEIGNIGFNVLSCHGLNSK